MIYKLSVMVEKILKYEKSQMSAFLKYLVALSGCTFYSPWIGTDL